MNNEFYIYLRLSPWCKAWLISKYGNPVKFDNSSVENAEIRHHLMRMPLGKLPLMKKSDNDVAIVIPGSQRKNPLYYNWMRQSSLNLLRGMMERNFDYCFKHDCWESIKNNAPIKDTVICWMQSNNISIDHYETLRQRINRMLMDYKKRGIYTRNSLFLHEKG